MDKAVMSVRMQKWAGIIQEAALSGMTKTEFCEQRGINRRQFFDWQKRIREYVLQQNPELGLPPARGQMQQIRAVNNQIATSLPVFCELKPPEETSAVPEKKTDSEFSFSVEAVIQFGEFRIFVGDLSSERTLSTILSVIRHA